MGGPIIEVDAVLFDLDGVLTKTASLHARAWKATFDDFLARTVKQRGVAFTPFDRDTDYRRYVDGKPRLDGVRDFLASRDIFLPEGTVDDSLDDHTVRGLGNAKNRAFLDLLERHGVERFEDAIEFLHLLHAQAIPTGMVTSSRNGNQVLVAAGLEDAFDTRVDGVEAAELGLAGKPAADTYVHAARKLGVHPRRALVLEDASAGVRAARAGGFGAVIGVERTDGADLSAHGADTAVTDLRQVQVRKAPSPPPPTRIDPRAGNVPRAPRDMRPVVFCDYDGTLAEIASRPEDARISTTMLEALMALAERCPVAVVSGRDLEDVRAMVGATNLVYAGSHGMDIAGPDLRWQHPQGEALLPTLDDAEAELRECLAPVPGARLERKRFAIAVHYRGAPADSIGPIEQCVDAVVRAHSGFRQHGGKAVYEIRPEVTWDKGRAVLWLLERLDLLGHDVLPIYIGDDVTDEDAFAVVAPVGLAIRVGELSRGSHATHYIESVDAVQALLRSLAAKS